jgi:hypothetical protein
MNELHVELTSINKLLAQMSFFTTLQRLGILNRFEAFSTEDGTWDLKQ